MLSWKKINELAKEYHPLSLIAWNKFKITKNQRMNFLIKHNSENLPKYNQLPNYQQYKLNNSIKGKLLNLIYELRIRGNDFSKKEIAQAAINIVFYDNRMDQPVSYQTFSSWAKTMASSLDGIERNTDDELLSDNSGNKRLPYHQRIEEEALHYILELF